jgi:Tfp pilus assembly protein PilZ
MQKRIAKNLLAKVTAENTEFFAYVQDVAKNGLGFMCNREMDVGVSIDLSLNVPGKASMELKGKIVWMRKLPSLAKNKFQYGMMVDEKPDEYDEYVDALVQRQYERRAHPRFQAVLEVKNDDVLDLLDAATENVSAAGLYIRTGRPLTLGGQYEMALSGEDLEKPLLCIGEVVNVFQCEPDEMDHPYGAGVKIISFVGDDKERFTDYIRKLEKLYQFHWPDKLE